MCTPEVQQCKSKPVVQEVSKLLQGAYDGLWRLQLTPPHSRPRPQPCFRPFHQQERYEQVLVFGQCFNPLAALAAMSASDYTRDSIEVLRRLSSLDDPLCIWAQNQQARLNLWADTLGVFAHSHLSLAHRLRLNEEVRDILVLLLKELHGSLILLCSSNPYSIFSEIYC